VRPVSDRRRRRDAVYPQRREQVWERGLGLCEHCLTRPMSEIHHVAGRGGPDPHRLENLKGLCTTCHLWAHANPEEARKAGLMASRHRSARMASGT
jgi:5-methylcytosine-specific restriction endonuclease McrA